MKRFMFVGLLSCMIFGQVFSSDNDDASQPDVEDAPQHTAVQSLTSFASGVGLQSVNVAQCGLYGGAIGAAACVSLGLFETLPQGMTVGQAVVCNSIIGALPGAAIGGCFALFGGTLASFATMIGNDDRQERIKAFGALTATAAAAVYVGHRMLKNLCEIKLRR